MGNTNNPIELVDSSNGLILTQESKKVIADYLYAKKKFEESEKALKSQIMNVMVENNIIRVSTDEFTITYVAESFSETFDKARFKEEHEELYNAYITMTPKAPSLRFTPKKKKEKQ